MLLGPKGRRRSVTNRVGDNLRIAFTGYAVYMADRRYGTTTQQGYGSQHQRLRAQLAPAVALGTTACVRCGQLIPPGQPWDLGHKDGTGKREYAGPEHTTCNRSAGAKLRNARALDPAPQPMTRW